MKKKMLVKRAQALTQHFVNRSNQAAIVTANVGGRALYALRNIKTFIQHMSGYPKIVFLPFLLLSSAAYGYHSVKSTSIQYQEEARMSDENPINDFKSLKKWITTTATSAVVDVVASKEVKKEGLTFLEKMFKNKQVHDALLTLFKGGVKD